MILVSFFFSHRALSKNLSRNGIGLKVTKFGDTDKQTDRHFSFNIKRLGCLESIAPSFILLNLDPEIRFRQKIFSIRQKYMLNTIQSIFLRISHVFVSIYRLFQKIGFFNARLNFKMLIFGCISGF